MKRYSQAKVTKIEAEKVSRSANKPVRASSDPTRAGTDKAPWQVALDAFDEAERKLHKKEASLSGFSETVCPYCGETTEVVLDAWDTGQQEFVEDCEVCCQPHSVRVERDRESGELAIYTEKAS